MKTATENPAKKYALSVAVLFVFFALLATMHLLTVNSYLDGVRDATQLALDEWSDQPITVGKRIQIPDAGWGYQNAYETVNKRGKVNGVAFVLQVTGNAGPYTGVFWKGTDKPTVFCGLVGVSRKAHDASYYGLSQRIIGYWTAKCDAVISTGKD
jgi:hypothetical protein